MGPGAVNRITFSKEGLKFVPILFVAFWEYKPLYPCPARGNGLTTRE